MHDTRGNEADRIGEDEADIEQPPNSYDPSLNQIQARLTAVEAENLELRSRWWRLHNKGTVPTGIIMSSIGGVILFFSYILSSSILTFIGLGLALWGLLIIYISPSRHVSAELLNSISSSMQKCVDDLVTYLGYNGEVIFFHPKSLKGLGRGHVFISHYAAKVDEYLNSKIDTLSLLPYSNEDTIPSVYLHPKGIFLVAPSQSLVDLFERELGINLATVDLSYIQQNLPKLLIEDLKIVDEIAIEDIDNASAIVMSFAGGPCADMCMFSNKQTKLGNNLGCPLCSAAALVVSKVTGKPVTIKETKTTDGNMISTTLSVVNP